MPSDVDEEIMCATCRALCSHGYAGLTMQAIADEYSKSKAALHYHFDSKRDLLVAFQEFLGDRFLERVREADAVAGDDPADRLSAVLDAALSPPESDDLEDLQTALLELKAQAPYEERYREQSEAFNDAVVDLLSEILAAGVESSDFQSDIDPRDTAEFLLTVLEGSQVRNVAVGQRPERTRDLLASHLERQVYAQSGSPEDSPEGGR
ncbi:TetR/AcrR family transcriptional regulator [Halobacteriales archaeon Cl-PHB]